jgi:hypothetical protein
VIYLKEVDQEQLCARYWAIREAVRSDPEYARLTAQLDALEPRWEQLLAPLSDDDRAVIEQFVLLRENRNLRMLEFACEQITP